MQIYKELKNNVIIGMMQANLNIIRIREKGALTCLMGLICRTADGVHFELEDG